jgi:hypothetical protein
MLSYPFWVGPPLVELAIQGRVKTVIIRVIPVVDHLLLDFPPHALDLLVELGGVSGEEDELQLVGVGGEERTEVFRVVHARVVQKEVNFPRAGNLGNEANQAHEEGDGVEPLDVLEEAPPRKRIHRADDVHAFPTPGRWQAGLHALLREALLRLAAELEPALVEVHDHVPRLLVAVNRLFLGLEVVLFFDRRPLAPCGAPGTPGYFASEGGKSRSPNTLRGTCRQHSQRCS